MSVFIPLFKFILPLRAHPTLTHNFIWQHLTLLCILSRVLSQFMDFGQVRKLCFIYHIALSPPVY